MRLVGHAAALPDEELLALARSQLVEREVRCAVSLAGALKPMQAG